jgi:predicted DNA-binding antitoxin AbrB/MazE fold protein
MVTNMGIKVKAKFQGSALKPNKEIGLKEGEEVQIVVEKSAVDKFHGMTKIPKKLADDIIEMEIWD